MREPSVSIPFVNTALNNLYKYGNDWIYTLQVGVTAGHQFEFQELKYKNYDYLLSDMPYSSFIYGKIQEASGKKRNQIQDSFRDRAGGWFCCD